MFALDLDAWSDLEQRLESTRRIDEAHHLRRTLYHLQHDYDEHGNYLKADKKRRLVNSEGSNDGS